MTAAAPKTLTAKQTLFVLGYLKDLNATQAAIRAGYAEKTAYSIGCELLKKPEIIAAIDAAMAKRADKLEISADRVLAEIARMAFYDPAELIEISREPTDDEKAGREFVGDDVSIIDGKIIVGLREPRDIKFLPEAIRRAIVGWGYDRNNNFTIKLADKSKALDQLARHLSLYNDKLKVEGLDGLADRLERASKRNG